MDGDASVGTDMQPPLPRHHPLATSAQTCVLEVAVVGNGDAAACAPVCVRFSYPMKLVIPRHLASFQLGEKATSSRATATVPTPVWAFVVNYGGGVVAGDILPLAVSVRPGATLVLTSQGATKVYASRGAAAPPAGEVAPADVTSPGAAGVRRAPRPPAVLSTVASVARGGLLAILPDPLMCFAASACVQATCVTLAPDASVAVLDWTVSGRRARGESWDLAALELRTHLMTWHPTSGASGGGGDSSGSLRPLVTEACVLRASAVAPLAARLGPAHVIGTLILYGPRCVRACVRVAVCAQRARSPDD